MPSPPWGANPGPARPRGGVRRPPDLELLRDLLASRRGEAGPEALGRLRDAGLVDERGRPTPEGRRLDAVLLTLLARALRRGP